MKFAASMDDFFQERYFCSTQRYGTAFTHSRTSKLELIFWNPATDLSTKFMQYSKSLVVISVIFIAPSPGGDSVSRIPATFFAHLWEAAPHLLHFYHEIAAVQWHLQAPLLILLHLLCPSHLQLLPPPKFWTPQGCPWGLDILPNAC